MMTAAPVFATTDIVEEASYRNHLTFICYMFGTAVTLEDWEKASAVYDKVAQNAINDGAAIAYTEAMRHAGITRAEATMERWKSQSEAEDACGGILQGQ
ncbi:hypothetical protein [Loktanella salsilacus]|uniref:hypothetical protein n=1 Tax=Loktanella salsilacus TaxID=195913 RepID=UPI003734EACA